MCAPPEQSGSGRLNPSHPMGAFVSQLHDCRSEIDQLREEIVRRLKNHCFDDAGCFAIRLALEEAISNAFAHGVGDLRNGDNVTVEVVCKVDSDEVYLCVTDPGVGFDPEAVPDPRLDRYLECPTGRGLLLMRAYMTSVRFNHKGNAVTMTRKRVHRQHPHPPRLSR